MARNRFEVWDRTIVTPPSSFIDASLLLGRILAIPALVHAGLSKIDAFGAVAKAMGGDPEMLGQFFPNQTPLFHFPAPELFLALAILFDLGGTLLMILGLKTRAVSLLLLGYVILAVSIFHSDIRTVSDAILLVVNAPLFGILLVLGAVGGGHWSLDGALARRRAGTPATA